MLIGAGALNAQDEVLENAELLGAGVANYDGRYSLHCQRGVAGFSYAGFAESIGLCGIRVERPEQLPEAWDLALRSDRPLVLETITDPDTPTLPPHITLKVAKNFTETILRGDPNEGDIVKQAVKGMVQSLIPNSGK